MSQKGFVPTYLIALMFILIGAGGGAYLLGRNYSQSPQNLNNQNITVTTQPRGNPPPGPMMSRDGPQNDETYITFSEDGKNWEVGKLVAKQASVPDVVELVSDLGKFKKGDLLVYYVDFSKVIGPGDENVAVVASSDNGKSWSDKTIIKVKNKANKGAVVDPSLVQLEDGTLRLYFFGSEITQGDPAQAPGKHKVYSAISSDGVSFEAESGVRFEDTNLTDPEVIFYKSNWYMYYSVGQELRLATSIDGLTFFSKSITGGNIGGVPGALEINGGVRVWGCGQGLSQGFASDGINFRKEQDDIFNRKIQGIVCDPAATKTSDGRYALVYKTRKTIPNNQVGQPSSPR